MIRFILPALAGLFLPVIGWFSGGSLVDRYYDRKYKREDELQQALDQL